MTPEEIKLLVLLLRQHIRALADVRALRSLVEGFAQTQQPIPADWISLLVQLQQTPGYRTFLEQYEPLLGQIVQEASGSALSELIRKMREGEKPS